jgi:hypothetical protein
VRVRAPERHTGGRGSGLRAPERREPRQSLGAVGLGAGLVEVPPVPYRDPAAAILADPRVPEHKRFCSHCEAPVGRAQGDRPGRAEGFCTRCGSGYSFAPKLAAGELHAARALVCAGGDRAGGEVVLGCRLTDREVRRGLERHYRTLARLERDKAARRRLVEQANAVRPLTWI